MAAKISLWRNATLVILVLAGGQAVATLARTPAFNPSLRVEAADGSTRPGLMSAMYNEADYLFWIAWGWQQARAGSTQTEGDVEAERLARANRARSAVIASLRRVPGNPDAWMVLAKADATLGNNLAALAAWRASFGLAPHNATRALDRIYFLARFMAEPDRRSLALAEIDASMVRSDLWSMREKPSLAAVAARMATATPLSEFVVE